MLLFDRKNFLVLNRQLSAAIFVVIIGLMLVPMGCGKDASKKDSDEPLTQDDDNDSPGLTKLFLSSNQTSCSEGQMLNLQVRLETGREVYGAAFDVAFPAGFEYVSSERSEFLESNTGLTHFMASLESEDKNRVVVGVSRVGDVPGQSGKGVLAQIHLKCLSSHSSSFGITLDHCRLMDHRLKDIPIDAIKGL